MLSLYMKYHRLRTDAPIMFGYHLGIQLIGHSLGRNSYCAVRPRAVHFNTDILLLADSGDMKSTAQEEVMEPLIPIKHRGDKTFSPQGLMRILEEQSQLLVPMGEFSTILRGIVGGGNMCDFKEISNDLYGCPPIYSKRLAGRGSYLISEPYLSMCTTCTEEEFFGNIKDDMVNGGFLARWLLIHGEANRYIRGDLHPDIDKYETVLRLIVGKMYEHFKKKPIVFKLSKEADIELFNITSKLYKNEKYKNVKPFTTRMENYIIKYSCILNVSRMIGNVYKLNELNELNKLNELIDDIKKGCLPLINSLNSLIQPDDIKLAWSLLKPSLDYSTKVSDYVNIEMVLKKFFFHVKKLKVGERIDWSSLMRNTGLGRTTFAMAVYTFVDREDIDLIAEEKGEGKSKATTKYIVRKEKRKI